MVTILTQGSFNDILFTLSLSDSLTAAFKPQIPAAHRCVCQLSVRQQHVREFDTRHDRNVCQQSFKACMHACMHA